MHDSDPPKTESRGDHMVSREAIEPRHVLACMTAAAVTCSGAAVGKTAAVGYILESRSATTD